MKQYTTESLKLKRTCSRPHTMAKDQTADYILNFVDEMNMKYKLVNYKMIKEHIKNSLNKHFALKTTQRYGRQECSIKSKTAKELISGESKYSSFVISEFGHCFLMTVFLIVAGNRYWHDIAKFQRFLQILPNDRLIFKGETDVY